ncbi:MAG: DUF488 family protein [Rhizobiales bacterium]|nr:DUF488 family protein [Hyphomicrobiales bacterium]
MSVRIVRLGSPRQANEGLRIGTVRRLPRGVRKEDYASKNWFDVWYPELSPSAELVKKAQESKTAADWAKFEKAFRTEMNRSEPNRTLDLLAALSHQTDFSVGCYCEDEAHCHRKVLRALLAERDAMVV